MISWHEPVQNTAVKCAFITFESQHLQTVTDSQIQAEVIVELPFNFFFFFCQATTKEILYNEPSHEICSS